VGKSYVMCGEAIMSRVGRRPIPIPEGIEVEIKGRRVRVKGPKGELEREFHPDMIIEKKDGNIVVSRPTDNKLHRSLHGLTRTLIANMIEGVKNGYRKILEVVGTGYRAQKSGNKIVLNVGFTHPVELEIPKGIEARVEGTQRIVVEGIDKEAVGQFAAKIRAVRPPDPYVGKGIRYFGEEVRKKPGKAGRIGKK